MTGWKQAICLSMILWLAATPGWARSKRNPISRSVRPVYVAPGAPTQTVRGKVTRVDDLESLMSIVSEGKTLRFFCGDLRTLPRLKQWIEVTYVEGRGQKVARSFKVVNEKDPLPSPTPAAAAPADPTPSEAEGEAETGQ